MPGALHPLLASRSNLRARLVCSVATACRVVPVRRAQLAQRLVAKARQGPGVAPRAKNAPKMVTRSLPVPARQQKAKHKVGGVLVYVRSAAGC